MECLGIAFLRPILSQNKKRGFYPALKIDFRHFYSSAIYKTLFNNKNFFMPFTLSLKPQQTEVIIPSYEFNNMHEAENKADEILKTFSGLYFVAIFFSDEHTPSRLITNVIQRGYKQVSWSQFKMFDRFNRLKGYFVLNGNHYVKLINYKK